MHFSFITVYKHISGKQTTQRYRTHLFSGNIVAHSAVIRASGTLHTRGRMMKPRMVKRGPPEDTASFGNASTGRLAGVAIQAQG